MSALILYAKASADFEAKLAETKAVLLSAAQTFSPLTQASSRRPSPPWLLRNRALWARWC